MLLTGDIGGTNTRLALFSDDARELVRDAVFPSASHRSLGAAIDAFLGAGSSRARSRPRLKGATFGIAGPVLNGRVKATNLPWTLDERALARKLGLRRVTLINDLVALALGAVAARKKDLHVLQGARPPRAAGGTVVVIAAGTGLGEAALVWDGARLVPCGTEGGHTDFAPRAEEEWELREFVARRIHGRVSYERVLSGPGLGTIYDFFRDVKRVPEPPSVTSALAIASDRNAAIAEIGGSGRGESEACTRALDLFASLYGAEAGNLALKYLAVGGVFVAGNIAARLLPTLERRFVPAFVDKGRFGPLLARVPVAVVKSSSIGLHGSARHAAGLT
jgi:glucokinase